MKFYIKTIALMLCTILLFTACGGEEETPGEYITDDSGGYVTDENGDPVETQPVTDSTEETTTVSTEPDPTKPLEIIMGFIYSGTLLDSTLNTSFEIARKEIMRANNIETYYIEGVLVQQFDEAADKLIDDYGCNVIVAASNHFVSSVAVRAKNETGGVKYISYGGSTYTSNLTAYQPALYQPANICGLVAAFNTDSNKIGVVADDLLFHAYGILDAFALGVKDMPHSSIDLSLIWALSDEYETTKRAIDDLVAQGCDIIFLYQSTEYGIKYCEQIGVKVIGFAYNMPELAPTSYLTGFYAHSSTFLVNKVRLAQNSSFAQDAWFTEGLKTSAVRLISYNEEASRSGTDRIIETYYSLVESGSSLIFEGEIRDTNKAVRVENFTALSTPQIYEINWLEGSYVSVETYSKPRNEEDLQPSDLEVQR